MFNTGDILLNIFDSDFHTEMTVTIIISISTEQQHHKPRTVVNPANTCIEGDLSPLIWYE